MRRQYKSICKAIRRQLRIAVNQRPNYLTFNQLEFRYQIFLSLRYNLSKSKNYRHTNQMKI